MQNLTQIQIALNLAISPNKTMLLKHSIHICICKCSYVVLYLTQIQIALNLAISPEQNNGKAAQAGGEPSEGHTTAMKNS